MKKQVMLGAGLMTAGAIMVTALLKQPKETPVTEVPTGQAQTAVVTTAKPLTVDADTEAKILQDKQKERQAIVEQAQAQNSELMAQRQSAEALALEKAQSEAEVVSNLKVQTRPEAIALAKQQAEAERQKQEAQKQAEAEKQAREAKAQDDSQKSQQKVDELKAKLQAQKAEVQKAEQKAKEQKAQEQKVQAQKLETQKLEAQKAEQKAQEQKIQAQKLEAQKAQEKTKQKADEQKTKESKTTPKTHLVQAGDNLIRLSKEYNIPVSVLAEANGMGRNDSLNRGRTIKIPSAREVKDLQYLAQKREQERLAKAQADQKRQEINDRLSEARREAKKQGVNDGYSVQVSLATSQAKADEIADAYRKSGYKVRTVKEARGVRVVVGTERSREAATALKDKINHDSRVKADGAWVIQDK